MVHEPAGVGAQGDVLGAPRPQDQRVRAGLVGVVLQQPDERGRPGAGRNAAMRRRVRVLVVVRPYGPSTRTGVPGRSVARRAPSSPRRSTVTRRPAVVG
ncbi:hypothetical protein Cma02nite_29450 [Cellulomonas marina]|nr:hypothetical protein Cma02nite_29450 [Cellulomonas marina]